MRQRIATWIGTTASLLALGYISAAVLPAGVSAAPANWVWKAPSVTRVGESEGYDPGTDWASLPFQCNGWWNGNDDDDTWLVVRFPQPTQIAGFRFGSLAASGAHGGYSAHVDFRATSTVVKFDDLPASSVPFFHIDADLLPMIQTSPGVWKAQLTQIERTFTPPVTVTYLRIDMYDIGSWTNLSKLRILTSAGTAGGVC